MNPRFAEKLEDYLTDKSPELPSELLEILASYQDVLHARTDFNTHDQTRAMASLHIMNHVAKTRQRILKNNEALAGNPDNNDRETRDQGFTRPKALILLPTRNSAIPWMEHLMHFSLATQVENKARFLKEFSLPNGVADKLAKDERDEEGHSKYPRDHRETFKGNIDDTFRVGMKITRKSIKLYSEFYQSDVIIASPLGLRTSIENQK
jgi:U3 small nucleolar RNA-associated protein 25